MDPRPYLSDPHVLGVFLTGSRVAGTGDEASDWDIVVLTDGPVSDELRDQVAASSNPTHLDRAPGHFGDGDCWRAGGQDVDVMFWDYEWIYGSLEAVITRHQVSEGYSTAHWMTVATWTELGVSEAGAERVAALNELAATPLDDELAWRIIDHNYRLIRPVLFSYEAQIAKAAERGDIVSLNHRIAALLASWFDIVFAANKVLHPGEKRLLDRLAEVDHPAQSEEDIRALCGLDVSRVGPFIDSLEEWLDAQGLRRSTPVMR